jgi:hypothetical protein
MTPTAGTSLLTGATSGCNSRSKGSRKASRSDERIVMPEEGTSLGREFGTDGYWETSAKTGENVRIVFGVVVSALYNKWET